MEEVSQYKSGQEINYSALTKRYPITVTKSGKSASNPGQRVKQYLIESGRATKLKDGELRKEIFSVYGRKMQLLDIRKEMLKKHKEFLRLRNDEEYGQMIREIIIDGLIRINEFSIGLIDATREVLLNKLVSFERTRHLMFWHDGSSLDNHSHILMTVGVMMSLFKNITKQFIIYKQLLKNHFFIF